MKRVRGSIHENWIGARCKMVEVEWSSTEEKRVSTYQPYRGVDRSFRKRQSDENGDETWRL